MIHYRYRTSLHRALLAGILLAAILTGGVFMPHHTAHAQDTTNLLTNGGLERPYYGQASATQTAPQGWTLWVGGGNPEAFPHNDPVQVLDGSDSWNIHQGYTAFIAAGYQRVGGLSQGDALEFTAYGWAYTCNDTTNSCVIQEAPYRRSDTAAGVSMKVGIDPTGGTDPYAGTVQWSGSAAPYDQWARLSVSAAAQGDTVTVFMFASQQAGLALNNVYWDKASLIRTNGVTVNASGTPVAATAVQQQVVFTSAQPPQTDGSIIHTVQQGDTLSGIAYAYVEYGVTIQSIADLDPVIEPNTRFLTVGQKIMILPPGSVDPETGDLLAPGQTLPTAAPTGADTTPVPAATDPDAQSTRIPTPTPLSAQLPTPTPAPQVTATPTEIRSMGWLRPLPTVPPQPISRAEPVQEVAQAITAEATEPVVADLATEDAAPSRQMALDLDAATEEVLEVAAAPTATATIPLEAAIATATPQTPLASSTPADALVLPSATPQQVAAASVNDATTGTLCVTIYEDTNQNLIRDADEVPLSQGEVNVSGEDGSTATEQYSAAVDPLCLDLPAGRYTIAATLPGGFWLTTSGSASVQLTGGRAASVMFGGISDPQPTIAPKLVSDTIDTGDGGAAAPALEDTADADGTKSLDDSIRDNIGLIMIGLAGVIVVSGGTAFLLLRRPER